MPLLFYLFYLFEHVQLEIKKNTLLLSTDKWVSWKILVMLVINLPSSYLPPRDEIMLWLVVLEGLADFDSFWSNIVFFSKGVTSRSVLVVGITSTTPLYNVRHYFGLVPFFVPCIAARTLVSSLGLHSVF